MDDFWTGFASGIVAFLIMTVVLFGILHAHSSIMDNVCIQLGYDTHIANADEDGSNIHYCILLGLEPQIMRLMEVTE